LYDPSIGQESLTAIDVIGVLVGHVIFGVAATFLLDWSWIPLSAQQKESGSSLKDMKKRWGWGEKNYSQDESLIKEDNE